MQTYEQHFDIETTREGYVILKPKLEDIADLEDYTLSSKKTRKNRQSQDVLTGNKNVEDDIWIVKV